jgi:hypothetical protein
VGLPEQVSEKEEGEVYEQHLFCDGDGKFQTKLNVAKPIVESRKNDCLASNELIKNLLTQH